MEEKIRKLWEETRDLSLGNTTHIARLHTPPSPLQFLRDFVSPNRPFIVSGATLHWPATALWSSSDYLLKTLSNSSVSLHLTPTGAADSLTPGDTHPLCFASAHVEKVLFPHALSAVLNSEDGCVAYAQQQNDCLRSEYGGVAADCEGGIPWATEALGCEPEAVNLWIGNELSETWFHKDHYENLYAVVTGEKHFLLLPPCDVHRMYIRDYPAAHYVFCKDTGDFKLELEDPVRYVPWCSVNPYPSPESKETEIAKFPLYFEGPKPFECTVKAGEILYLPRYDMRFDVKYAYYNFLQSIDCRRLDHRTNNKKYLESCDSPFTSNSEDDSDNADIADGYGLDLNGDIVNT